MKFFRKFNNLNGEFSICSVATDNFNAYNSMWQKNDLTDSVDLELDSLTSSFEYIQILDKANHGVSNSVSCTNQNLMSKIG